MPPALTATLAAASAALAGLWSRPAPGPRRAVRLAPAVVVGAILALPPREAAAVGLAAIVGSGGAGLGGPWCPGARAAGASLVALAAALGAAHALPPLPPWAAAVAVYAALAGAATAVGLALRAPAAEPNGRAALFELLNVPAAFLIADRLATGRPLPAAGALALLVAGAYAAAALSRERAAHENAQHALAARVSELATLHSIGRDIVTTLDPGRVFAIVERECRKLFEVHSFFLAVLDREAGELRVTYRSLADDAPRELRRPLGDGLLAWVVREKRAIRLDDATAEPQLFLSEMEDDASVRSVLAVPLLVDDRVVGVLSARSLRAHAYDEHHLSVLATIAQQAAVAIENARHYAMTTTDSLTGLYLRDAFFRRLSDEYTRARRYASSFAVLMLDLDGFKEINDRHGHAAGDRYLRAVGAVIQDRLRGADLACRYGGDEFCLLLPVTDIDGARAIAERVRQAVAGLAVDWEGACLRATVSIGVAAYPQHDSGDLKALLLRADQALYNAKRGGRDRVVPYAA